MLILSASITLDSKHISKMKQAIFLSIIKEAELNLKQTKSGDRSIHSFGGYRIFSYVPH